MQGEGKAKLLDHGSLANVLIEHSGTNLEASGWTKELGDTWAHMVDMQPLQPREIQAALSE